MSLFDQFRHIATEHPCPQCTHKLSRVEPSNMLVCHNPDCTADPHFLV